MRIILQMSFVGLATNNKIDFFSVQKHKTCLFRESVSYAVASPIQTLVCTQLLTYKRNLLAPGTLTGSFGGVI